MLCIGDRLLAATILLAVVCSPALAACPGGGNCSGHGACLPGDICTCNAGYVGPACDQCATNYYNYPTCTFCQAISTCTNHGSCTPIGTCVCNVGFTGPNCSTCAEGYYGPSCLPCPGGAGASQCSGHGLCDDGASGSGICSCTFPWVGPACQSNCNGHGNADINGICFCFPGYTGTNCQFCAPNYYNYPTCTFCLAATTCSNHGTCNTSGGCVCDAGWTGANCSVPAVPSAVQWRSVRTHAGDGELGIVIDPAPPTGNGISGPTVETRQGGIQKIVVDFNRSVTLVDTSGVTVTGRTTDANGVMGSPTNYLPASVSMVDSDTMQILFVAGFLPNQSCYTIAIGNTTFAEGITPGSSVMIRSLVGDATSSGTLTLSDPILIVWRATGVLALTAPMAPAFDINLSGGVINVTDALAAKAQIISPIRKALCP